MTKTPRMALGCFALLLVNCNGPLYPFLDGEGNDRGGYYGGGTSAGEYDGPIALLPAGLYMKNAANEWAPVPGFSGGGFSFDSGGFDDAVTHINGNDGHDYRMVIGADIPDVTSQTLGPLSGTTRITIEGLGGPRKISLSALTSGGLFLVNSNVELSLGGGITLEGHTNNDYTIVHIGSGGTLIMLDNSMITGNINTAPGGDGGGVYVGFNGTFIMQGGAISGNKADYGGGVYVATDGIFTMEGPGYPVIKGNTADHGGGVYTSGTFTMDGGTIYGTDRGGDSNIASPGYGASVYRPSGTAVYGSSYGGAPIFPSGDRSNDTLPILSP